MPLYEQQRERLQTGESRSNPSEEPDDQEARLLGIERM